MLKKVTVFFAAGVLSIPAFPANEPFAGTWKFNREKSDLKGQTETIASLGDNKFRFSYGTAVSFDIKADGTDQTSLPGATLAITVKDPNTWEFVSKTNGTKTGTGIWTLSADGKSILNKFKGTRPDGSEVETTGALKRVSGSGGFAGTWQVTDVSIDNPSLLQIETSTGGLVVTYPSDKVTMNVTFDGKEFPVDGPTVPKGATASAKRIDTQLIRITDKLNGKVMDTTDWKLSSGGKVLTQTEHDAGEKKATVSIYDRQ